MASNYTALNAAASQVSVTPAPVAVTTADVVKTYDGSTSATGASAIVSSGSLFGGDALSGGSFAFADKNAGVGNKTVTVAGVTVNDGNGGANYTVTHVNNTTSTIHKADLAVVGSRVYDGTTSMLAPNLSATGVAGERFALAGSGTLATKDVQTNQSLASVAGLVLGAGANGAVASNYNSLSTVGSAVNVTPATLLVTGSRVYDGTTTMAANDLAVSGVAGETFAVSGSGTLASKNVQTHQAMASTTGLVLGAGGNGGLASNYQAIEVATSSVSVTPRALVVAYAGVDKLYDGHTAATVLTADDRVAGDSLGILRTGNFRDPQVGQGKPVDVTAVSLTGADAGNYTVAPTGLTSANIVASGTDGGTLTPTLPPAAPAPPAAPPPGVPDGPVLVSDPPFVVPPVLSLPPAGEPLGPDMVITRELMPPAPTPPVSAPPPAAVPATPPSTAAPTPAAPTSSLPPVADVPPRAPAAPEVRVYVTAPVQEGVPGRIFVVLPSDTVSHERTVWIPLPDATVNCHRGEPLAPVQVTWQREDREDALPSWLGFDTQSCALWAREVPEGRLPALVKVAMGSRTTWVALTKATGL